LPRTRESSFDRSRGVHGISNADLEGQPRFADIADELLEFLRNSELVIHNAEFDVGFLEYELTLMNHARPVITEYATVLDTLQLARKLHPGQRNNLDALCKRYAVDASRREVHGALIDAELLARVYLAMTGGQTALSLDEEVADVVRSVDANAKLNRHSGPALKIVTANAQETAAHDALLDKMQDAGACIWRNTETNR
jgi:DNA polymerase-3 subunit epsilon